MRRKGTGVPFTIVEADITTLQVDAIVNAANGQLLMGGGVCGAIFRAAGPRELQAACDEIGRCDTGSAVVTPGFRLPAKYVIHAVGPVWQGGSYGERGLLASCYTTSLRLAADLGCASVAFPLISSGIYGYPRAEAYQVAQDAIEGFLADHDDMQVYLALFRGGSLLGSEERRSLDAFIDNHLARERLTRFGMAGAVPRAAALAAADAVMDACPAPMAAPGSLDDLLDNLDAPFGETLLAMIDERGLTDAEVYRRANMSRQHFAKLRAGGNPSKRTVLVLCVALELSVSDAELLLRRAGFALSPADKTDVIVTYFLERGGASVVDVNLALYEYNQPLLTR